MTSGAPAPPDSNALARFPANFGPRSLLTVDTEEEFDWDEPLRKDGFGLNHIDRLTGFQEMCERLGVSPLYLVDWPVANSPLAREVIGGAVRAGKAEVGIQLHPWVSPPETETINSANSFAGNLPAKLEAEKFHRLRDAITEGFGVPPISYRAGRYGLGPNTAAMLAEAGIRIDTSVRTHFDYSAEGGPDYRRHPLHPYWLDAGRTVLELPLTTVFWGMLRRQGPALFPALSGLGRVRGGMARAGLLERIPLTPEGVSAEEAIRGIDMALDDGLPLLVLSFHSPSLLPGATPYVRNESDLATMLDWWERIYAYLAQRNVAPTNLAQILSAVEPG